VKAYVSWELLIWGQCCDHNFLPFSLIFCKKWRFD
jgi:hypothetical protein